MQGIFDKFAKLCLSAERRNRKEKTDKRGPAPLLSTTGLFFPKVEMVLMFASLTIPLWIKVIHYLFNPLEEQAFQLNFQKLYYMNSALPLQLKISNRGKWRRSPELEDTFAPLLHTTVKKNMSALLDDFFIPVEAFMNLLQTSESFVCGSFALQCFLGKKFNTTCIDIFVDLSNKAIFESTFDSLFGTLQYVVKRRVEPSFQYGTHNVNIPIPKGVRIHQNQRFSGILLEIITFTFNNGLCFMVYIMRMDVDPFAKPPIKMKNFTPFSDLTLTSIAIGVDCFGQFHENVDNYEDLAFERLYPKDAFYEYLRMKWFAVMTPKLTDQASFKASLTAANGMVFRIGDEELQKLELASFLNAHLHRIKKVF